MGALREHLGLGEAAAIAVALSIPGSICVLDDRLARRSALRLGLTVVGTLGLLLRAKQVGLIDAVKTRMEKLKAAGRFMTPELESKVLDLAGESEGIA